MDRIENAQMNSQGTRKLYYENVHQTDFTAVVMECVPDKEEGYYRIVLDASAFFPEEGGQSADKGTLNGQEVLDVSIKQGILYHKVACEFPVSTRVTGHVDWNRRFDFMQQHSGEHMILRLTALPFRTGKRRLPFKRQRSDTGYERRSLSGAAASHRARG